MITSTGGPSTWRGAVLSAGLHASALVLMGVAVSGGAAMVQEGRNVRVIPVAVGAPEAIAAPAASTPAPAPETAPEPLPEMAKAEPVPKPEPPRPDSAPVPSQEAQPVPVDQPEPPPEPQAPAVEDLVASAAESPAVLPEPRPDRPSSAPPEPAPAETETTTSATTPPAQAPADTAETPAEAPGAPAAPAAGADSGDAPTGAQVAALPLEGDEDGLAPPVVTDPRFRSPPTPPDYPRRAVRRTLAGVALVRALVDPSGRPGEIVVWRSSGHDILDAAARAAVAKWEFEPARRAGRAITAWVQVPVAFRLK